MLNFQAVLKWRFHRFPSALTNFTTETNNLLLWVPLGFLCSIGTTFPVVSRKSLNQNWLQFLPNFSYKFWTLMLLSNESCEQLSSAVNYLLLKGQQSPPQSWQLRNVSAKGQISRNRFLIFSTVKCWNELSRQLGPFPLWEVLNTAKKSSSIPLEEFLCPVCPQQSYLTSSQGLFQLRQDLGMVSCMGIALISEMWNSPEEIIALASSWIFHSLYSPE